MFMDEIHKLVLPIGHVPEAFFPSSEGAESVIIKGAEKVKKLTESQHEQQPVEVYWCNPLLTT